MNPYIIYSSVLLGNLRQMKQLRVAPMEHDRTVMIFVLYFEIINQFEDKVMHGTIKIWEERCGNNGFGC